MNGRNGIRQSADQRDEFVKWLFEATLRQGAIAEMDNKKLLWCLMTSKVWMQPLGSIEDELLQELAIRMYPELDGETTKWTEWGWETPNGPTRYI